VNQQVNLYHPIFRKQEKKFSAATMLQAGLIVLTGIVLMYGYAAWRTYALRAQQQEINAQYVAALARLNDVSAKLPMRRAGPRLEQEVRDLERRIEAVQAIRNVARRDLFKGGAGYSDTLVALARQSTAGLWITGLTLGGADDSVVLAGRTHSPELVPGYLQRLANEKTLAGQQFEIFQMTRPVRIPADANKHTDAVLESYIDFEVRSKPVEKPK
jgi:hypothetical protein